MILDEHLVVGKNNLMRIIMMKKYNQLRSPLESIISWLL